MGGHIIRKTGFSVPKPGKIDKIKQNNSKIEVLGPSNIPDREILQFRVDCLSQNPKISNYDPNHEQNHGFHELSSFVPAVVMPQALFFLEKDRSQIF